MGAVTIQLLHVPSDDRDERPDQATSDKMVIAFSSCFDIYYNCKLTSILNLFRIETSLGNIAASTISQPSTG